MNNPAEQPDADAAVDEADLETFKPQAHAVATPGEDAAAQTAGSLPDFGEYTDVSLIGRGGMGVVYRAWHTGLKRVVAVKMLPAGVASDAVLMRFQREAEAAARLDHPGIVPVFEIGRHDGRPFFAMGFVDGEPLSRTIREQPLAPRVAAELLSQIADAVEYAHANGVVHRDIKPSNILIDKSGRPRVADFGIARRMEADSKLTATGEILGTPSYMPPEQATGVVKNIGPASDVYSLGAVLYDILTGRPPFLGETAHETILQVIANEPVFPRILQPNVPRDLETICLKCLEKSPGARYPSAAALHDDLNAFLENRPISARPIGQLGRLVRWSKRRPTTAALVAAGIAILMLLTGGIVGWTYTNDLQSALGDAETQRGIAETQKELADSQAEAAEAARDEADGQRRLARRAAYVADMYHASRDWQEEKIRDVQARMHRWADDADLHGFVWRYFNGAINDYRLKISVPGNGLGAVAATRNGGALATCRDRTIAVWDGRTGKLERQIDGRAQRVRAIEFVPKSGNLVSGGDDRPAGVWDVQSGNQIRKFDHPAAVLEVAVDGTGALLATASADQLVRLWDLKSGERQAVLPADGGEVRRLRFSPDGTQLAGCSRARVFLWNVKTRRLQHEWKLDDVKRRPGNTTPFIEDIDFHPGGKLLATAHADGAFRLWIAESGDAGGSVGTGKSDCSAVRFSADGRHVVVACDHTVLVWDLIGRRFVKRFHNHPVRVRAIAMTESSVVSLSFDGSLFAWQMREAAHRRTFAVPVDRTGETQPNRVLVSAVVGGDGQAAFSTHNDGSVRKWNLETGEVLATYGSGDAKPVIEAGFGGIDTPGDGKPVAAVVSPSEVVVLDAQLGKQLHKLRLDAGGIGRVCLDTHAQFLAASSGDGTVCVWDLRTGKPAWKDRRGAENRRVAPASYLEVRPLAAHRAENWIALGADDGTLQIKDWSTGKALRTIDAHSQPVTAISFSGDGSTIATGDKDGEVALWSTRTGELIRRITVTRNQHLAYLSFSADGRILAAGQYLNSFGIRLYDVQTGLDLGVLPSSRITGLFELRFTADGRNLVAGHLAGITVWQAPAR